MRREAERSERHDVAVAHRAVDADIRKFQLGDVLLARIIAAFEQRLVGGAGDQLCAGLFLELGEAAGVIEMRMRVQDELDVRKFKTRASGCLP
jgi:hypothetical protein